MVYEMDRKTNSSKVSQITQLFQQNSQQITTTTGTIKPTTPEKPENFSKKFNSARAMFEKLGTSDEKEEKKVVTAATVPKFKPALPEKPEKKLNGRELIEKQKNWVSHFSVKKSPEKGFGVQPKSPLGSPVKSSLPDVVRREILPDIFSNENCVSVREMVRKRENSVEFENEIEVGLIAATNSNSITTTTTTTTTTTDVSQKLQVEVSDTPPHTNSNGDSNDLLKVQFPKEIPKHVNDVGRKDSIDDINSRDLYKVNFQLNHKEALAAKVENVFPKDNNKLNNSDIVDRNGVHNNDVVHKREKRESVTKIIEDVIEVKQVKQLQREIQVTNAIPPQSQFVPNKVIETNTGDVLMDFAEPKPKIEFITDVIKKEVVNNVQESKPEIVQSFVELNAEVLKSVVESKSEARTVGESKREVEIAEPKLPPHAVVPTIIFPPQPQRRKEVIPEQKKEVVKTEVKVEELLRSDLEEVNELIESLSEVNEIVESECKIEKIYSEAEKVEEEETEIYPMPPERRDSLKDSQVSYASIQIKPKVEDENSESTSESISNNSFASSQVTIIENVGEFKGSEEIEVQLKVNGFDRIRTAEFVDVSGGLTLDESFTGLTESSTDDPDHLMSSSAFMVESGKEVYFEAGLHYFEDGHYWVEVPGLPNSDEDDDYFDSKIIKKAPMRVRFSVEPMKVYTTHSVEDYDRRNEDVDPVAASAEYELEKRVEKMEVFSVELIKGPEGLGLSIIGMGVGADAGLEKLGIFVKTITEGGAAARDNRIQVNDQIIEVDQKSLVGVTQAYAASVLRNTSGLVKFLVGREKDPENSEVAQLIRQSLQADREREERRKLLEQPRGPPPPPPPPIHDPEVPTLKEKLKEKEEKLKQTETEIEILKRKLDDLQINLKEKENVEFKVKEMEIQLEEGRERLRATVEEVEELRNVVSKQTDTSELEKKYERVKKIVRLLQMREKDLFSRQEMQLLKIHERDGQYHDLLRSLKQRVNLLENELSEVTRRAGLPPHYLPPFPSIPPVPLPFSLPPPLPPIEIDLSDEENSVKEEFDSIPQHNLLDSSAGKAKADLASRGGLAGRQAPTVNKRPSSRSSNCSLDQEEIKAPSPELLRSVDTTAHQYTHRYTPNFRTPPISPAKSYTSGNSPQIEERLFSAYKAPSFPNPHFHTTTTPCFDYSISSHESSNHSINSSSVVYTNTNHSISSMSNNTSPISVIPLNVAIQMNNSNSSAIMTSIKEKSSRDEESFDSWQSRESESNSSSAVSTVETFPVPVPEKWMNLSPLDWSNEQVCQWLLFLNLEHLIPPFMDHSITGPRLLQLESKELKSFGVNGDDKLKIKKKIKEMKLRVDKEKKQREKEQKEREKLMKREKKKK